MSLFTIFSVYFKGKDLKIKGDSFPTPFVLTVNFKNGIKISEDFPEGGGAPKETTATAPGFLTCLLILTASVP